MSYPQYIPVMADEQPPFDPREQRVQTRTPLALVRFDPPRTSDRAKAAQDARAEELKQHEHTLQQYEADKARDVELVTELILRRGKRRLKTWIDNISKDMGL